MTNTPSFLAVSSRLPVAGWVSVIGVPSPTQYAVEPAVSDGNCTRPLGGSATSRAPAEANASRFRCRSISSPSVGSGTRVPPSASSIVPSAFLRNRPTRRPIQSASSGSNRAACAVIFCRSSVWRRSPCGSNAGRWALASGTRNDCAPWCGTNP